MMYRVTLLAAATCWMAGCSSPSPPTAADAPGQDRVAELKQVTLHVPDMNQRLEIL